MSPPERADQKNLPSPTTVSIRYTNRSESGWRTPRASRIPPKKEHMDRTVAIAGK
jgi:hypothetical protein